MARRQLRAQIRPFIVIDFIVQQTLIELSIKNIGNTMARNVRFNFDPPLKSSFDEQPNRKPLGAAALLAHGVAAFPPTKEYRVLFDQAPTRIEKHLPDRYDVTITYDAEPVRQTFTETTLLDLTPYYVPSIRRYDLSDVHKRLSEISTEVRKWRQGGTSGAVRVMTPRDVRREWAIGDLRHLAQVAPRSRGWFYRLRLRLMGAW